MKKDTTWRVNQYSYEAKNILTLNNKFRIMDSPYCVGNKKNINQLAVAKIT